MVSPIPFSLIDNTKICIIIDISKSLHDFNTNLTLMLKVLISLQFRNIIPTFVVLN